MKCPYPVSIRNPQLDATFVHFDGTDFVSSISGEVIPARIEVPCGRCIICQNARRDEWAARMELETRSSVSSYFVTLTYAPENRPEGDSLSIPDLQKFFKRFRRRYGSVRYFACGEYGDTFGAPHYHFVCWFSYRVDKVQLEAALLDVWKLGFVKVDPTTSERCRYVAKYCVKVFRRLPSEDATPPFAVMSRRPGIASNFYLSNLQFEHSYLHLSSGRDVPLPRFLLEKLDPIEQVSIKRSRREYAESVPQPSESERIINEINLERSLLRKYIRKYGK